MSKVTYFEMAAKNPERAAKFYKKVFGWRSKRWEGWENDGYWHLISGDEKGYGIEGGIFKDRKPGVYNTITVKSIDTAIKKIKAAKGKITEPKTAMGDWGYYATFKDPEGNELSIMEKTGKGKHKW